VKRNLVVTLLSLALACPLLAGQAGAASTTSKQTPHQVLNGTAKLVGHYNPSQALRVVFGLKPQNVAELQQLIKELHDKKSPQFHHFLTAEEWNARFAPSAQDEQSVVDWAESHGFTITQRYPNRLLVDVEATSGTIEKALNVTINSYQLGGKTYFSNDRDPSIPENLAGIVQSVGGLNNIQVLRPANKGAIEPAFPDYAPGPVVSRGPSGGKDADSTKLPSSLKGHQGPGANRILMTSGAYDPTDLYSSQAYDWNALYGQGHCCNPFHNAGGTPPETSIAIATAGTQQGSDFYGFQGEYPYLATHWAGFTYIDGSPSCCDSEGTMDFEWSTAMSNSFGSLYDTSEIYMYDGVNANFSTFNDIYNRILSDGYTRIMSTSWGCAENDCYDSADMTTADNIFSAMVAQGWTLVVAAGDGGATASCVSHEAVSFPASDPNVVAAGGTTLSLSAGPVFGDEVGWTGGPDDCYTNDGGGTGGFSAYWPTPSYQSGLGVGSRAVPDIALNADWYNTPQTLYFEGTFYTNCQTQFNCGGGTSIVAPEMAGFFANENAYLLTLGNICGGGSSACAPMGNADFYLYDEGVDHTAPHYPFYDVTAGCNNNDVTAYYGLGYYCAGPGYDEVTGWGSADMLQLAWAINWFSTPNIGAPSIAFSGPTVNQWYNTDQTVNWTVNDSSNTGVAGFTQGWDSIPTDPYSETTPGSGNSFYSGPEFPNATTGWLDFTGSGVSQGCHTVHVEGWNNMGQPSGDSTYGPICYDTVPPVTKATLNGTLSGSAYVSPVKVTLNATDSRSGVASTVYRIDGGSWLTYAAPFTVSALGAHTVHFYSTDKAGNTESTKAVSFKVDVSTSTAVTSSLNPSTYGQSVTFTATVTSSGGTPTGSVTFKNGSATLGTRALSSGKATFALSTLAAGSHSVTAVYAGSGNFDGSTSVALTQRVKRATSSTSVASSLNPSTYGASVKFTAKVTSSGGTPTGTVTFKNGSATLGTRALSGGKATFTTSTLPVGTHSVTAVYGTTTDFLTSTSPVLSQVVNQ